MARRAGTEPIDLEAALRNPAAVFATPEEVLEHSELALEQRIEILRCWAYDASELAVAEEEGMPGATNDLQRQVLLALGQLTHGTDVRYVGPTKQHGLLRRAVEPEK